MAFNYGKKLKNKIKNKETKHYLFFFFFEEKNQALSVVG